MKTNVCKSRREGLIVCVFVLVVNVNMKGEIRLPSGPQYFVSNEMAYLSIKDGKSDEKFFEVRFFKAE